MEIKAKLEPPYTEKERSLFIIEQNQKRGYEIREYKYDVTEEIEVADFEDVTKTVEVEIPYMEMEEQEIEVDKPVFEIDEETGEEVQVGVETVTEIVQVPVEKVRIEEQEVTETVQTGSHTEVRVREVVELQAWGYTDEELEEQRKEAIGNLTLTRGDVFAGLIQARMLDQAALAVIVDQMPETTVEEKMAKMLSKNALDNALNFHRNHPMVSSIGTQLGVSEENLDKFFETNDYHFLLAETEGNNSLNKEVEGEE